MHDIHVADKIYKLITENAQTNNIDKVRRIEINLGSIVEHGADISKENLEYNLKMLGQQIFAPDIEIIINRVSGNDWELVSISG